MRGEIDPRGSASLPRRRTGVTIGSLTRTFVIGDVHGCAEELEELLSLLPIDPDSTVIFLGDYIDRGPDSRRVIDLVLSVEKRCSVVALMGNHEEMFAEFLHDPQSAEAARFIYNWGGATLASYALPGGGYKIPKHHLPFSQGFA